MLNVLYYIYSGGKVLTVLFVLLFGCESDVSVIKRYDEETNEETAIDTVDTPIDTPTETATQTDTGILIEGNGGYLHYYLRQIACPACVGESQELLVEFRAKFFQPTFESHTSWIPTLGECTNQLLITSPSTNAIDVGPSISVDGPVHSFTAMQQGQEYYAYLYETQYDRTSTHYVSLTGEDEQITFFTAEGYDYIEPQEMLYIDPSYAFAAPIYKTGMTFSWSPYDTSRTFMVLLAVYSGDGSQLLGYAACTGPDQGFMTFPSYIMQSFPSYSLVLIHLSRHKVDFHPFEPMATHIETHMEWEVIGTGYLQ